MRIHIAGGGPAGLYFAFLMKTSFPTFEVRVIERNAADVTFGFGVVLSGRAQQFIGEGDRVVMQRIRARAQSWTEQHIVHRGQCVVVDGSAFSGIARIDLLVELQAIAREAGVVLEFGRQAGPDEARACDVLVAADGANSLLRDLHSDAFGTRVTDLKNYFAWYGVERPYAAHTLTFIDTPDGPMCAHHYRFKPDVSTFVAEVDGDAWQRAGLYAMDDDERRVAMERIFSGTLGGLPLLSNRSVWRRYRLVRNDRWWLGNMVLVGDALRTAHPSIGSGTRLAMEDAIALWRAFVVEAGAVEASFARYQAERKPVRDKLDRAAERSIDWYERVGEKMQLSPHRFAHDYLMRTGVMTDDRLERYSPAFMTALRQAGD